MSKSPSTNPYGLTDLGWCRLAALAYALRLANERELKLNGQIDFSSKSRIAHRLCRKEFQKAVEAKADQIHRAWKITEFPTEHQTSTINHQTSHGTTKTQTRCSGGLRPPTSLHSRRERRAA